MHVLSARCHCAFHSSMLGVNISNSADTAVLAEAAAATDGISGSESTTSNAVDTNSMAAAVDKSVVEVHADGSTPMETSNSSAGATATTILSVDCGQGDDSGTDTAGATIVDGIKTAKQSAANRLSRYIHQSFV